MMDVGGGSGAVSIALCRAFPALEAFVVDQPPGGRPGRRPHRATPGSATASPPGRPTSSRTRCRPDCDVAVLANVLHDFSPDRAQEILGRVVAALPRGGRVVILEIVPDEERRSPPLAVAFSVAMIVNTAGGDAHTASQYRAWLEAAGLADVVVTPIPGRMVTTVFEATKP